MKKLIRYFKRRKILLNNRYFYRSLKTNKLHIMSFVHPHCMYVITPEDLYNMSDEDFYELLGDNGYANVVRKHNT